MKRAAIELSINFIVIIIIALTIFGFGINFLYKIFAQSNELSSVTLEELDNRISGLMCGSNERVCVEKDTVQLKRGDLEFLSAKVKNIDPKQDFLVTIEQGIFMSPDKDTLPPDEADKIAFKPGHWIKTIKEYEDEEFSFAFQIPKKNLRDGTYVFNLNVYRGDSLDDATEENRYNPTKKIWIEVK